MMLIRMEECLIDNRKITVVDALMGFGKTSAAINYINQSDESQKFFFLSPYVDEGERVRDACPNKKFAVLTEKKGSKLNDLREKAWRQRNVASTHALFSRYTPDVLDNIRKGGYTLILDEAYAVTQTITATKKADFKMLLELGCVAIEPETSKVYIVDESKCQFGQRPINELFDQIRAECVYYIDNDLLIWVLPAQIMSAFQKIIILTYMFEAQPIKLYLQANGFQFEYWGTKQCEDGTYTYCDLDVADHVSPEIAQKIHILDHKKLNEIGDPKKALCSKWYESKFKNDKASIEKVGKAIRNAQKNVWKCKANDFMWTTYKRYRELIEDKNITKHFVSCKERATNKWRNRHYLAYAVNFFENPDSADYFTKKGQTFDVDRWALSEMLQWIWRSAIRNGEDIYIYIPSSRMRKLLEDWLEEISTVANEAA